MNRLTTDKPVSEMGMLELAYNSCIKKDGELVYRDFEKEVNARDFIRKVWSTYYGSPLPDDDDSLDYELMEMLSENPIDSAAGLIALLYRFMWTNADLRGEIKHYEDLEEKGRLVELPCKIGDDVYFIPSKVNYDLNVISEHEENNRVYHQKIIKITLEEGHWYITLDKDYEFGTGTIHIDSFFGETWFLTKEEAEKALEQMNSKV